MSNLRQAAEMALVAMENLYLSLSPESVLAISLNHRITDLRTALAEQNKCTHGVEDSCKECYMAEPDQEPLTDEEIEQAYRNIWRSIPADFDHTSMGWIEQGIRYAEQAHGIKRET